MPPLDLEQLNRLIVMVAEGNAAALDGIFALVGKRMFVLARGIVRREADAEDVLSESFLKIARFARSFRPGTNGYAWCMRIARNTALDFLRQRKIRAEAAMQHLDREEKRLIYFRYYLDLTVRDIAKELDVGKSTAARRLQAAEQKLLAHLAGKKED